MAQNEPSSTGQIFDQSLAESIESLQADARGATAELTLILSEPAHKERPNYEAIVLDQKNHIFALLGNIEFLQNVQKGLTPSGSSRQEIPKTLHE
jgi:hypothetical protein